MNNRISNITESDLKQFTRRLEHWYRHWTGKLVYTDGIHFLVENGAGWLLDAIASYQFDSRLKQGDLRHLQVWELKRDTTGVGATLVCRADAGRPAVIEQVFTSTDFPFPFIELWAVRGGGEELTLMLPGEW